MEGWDKDRIFIKCRDGPEWLTLYEYGDLDGRPDADPGEYSVTVKVTDSEGNSAEKTFTLKVNP